MNIRLLWWIVVLLCFPILSIVRAQTDSALTRKFALKKSGLELERRTQLGTFFDVVGRRAALAGYENRALEAWVYPLKILDDFKLSFRLQGYPLDINGPDVAVQINVRPEATTFTYTHAAFNVRQIIFAPLDEPGLVMLLDVQSVLPLTITASFRPRLKLMWPAGLMTGNLSWNEKERVYYITEESRRFVGVVGSPVARDVSVMPYQEEPRDVPAQLVLEVSADELKTHFIPLVIAGSSDGRAQAKAVYERLLNSVQALYEKNVAYYERLENETLRLQTPDERFNKAFSWAKVGIDKGFATNPLLGTGLVAGFRTSGESERPGFSWFFGRDALWTTFAINSYGDFEQTRAALEFLKKFQRADGKIPHEISQSASLLPWFTDYPYPWASADATPLYVIAHADYWRASGDSEFLKANWDSILKAYRFTEKTDTDGNALVENTNVGHGWVEGGALYPPHEEIYMQGLWIEASRSLAELATVMNDAGLAAQAKENAEKTRAATEQTYWLPLRGFYAYATKLPRTEPAVAEPGPNRDVRQARMDELKLAKLFDEDTILVAVPLWWRTLADERAQSELDHLGSGALATDWGARIISSSSKLYDPLSYHHGSVWPLFTGWAAMGAYRYGRPHIGQQALMANALLTYTGALGYVTELLSGDFNTPFGRSSHHQVWSEAMVVTPAVRGLLGLEATDGGGVLRFAPQLPINWENISVRNVRAGTSLLDFMLKRTARRLTISVARREIEGLPVGARRRLTKLLIAPAFPLDARIRKATVNGHTVNFNVEQRGDVQFAEVPVNYPEASNEIIFSYDEGTDVYIERAVPAPGAANEGLRILRSRADGDALRLSLEGLGGRSYTLRARSRRLFGETSGVTVKATNRRAPQDVTVAFDGPAGLYVRREIVLPFLKWK